MQALISPLSIAPMIDWTHRHFRYFMRLLLPQALLYTDMQTTGAILHQTERALAYSALEEPLALQLGGYCPESLCRAIEFAEQFGYQEYNLNLGCPSDRVQSGKFGACLMYEPDLVAKAFKAMKLVTDKPVTAKVRIGVDEQDDFGFFADFVAMLVESGIDKLIVHARKAWLKGLSPKQNRTIPPLHYDYAYNIKKRYHDLPIVLNGNITELDAITLHMQHVDGVMLGRLACDNPYALTTIHQYYYPDMPIPSRSEVMARYIPYMQQQLDQNLPVSLLLKPLYQLCHGLPGARQWKQILLAFGQNPKAEALPELLHKLIAIEERMHLNQVLEV